MKRIKILISLLLLALLSCSDAGADDLFPKRILSASPAATEILFDLGLGERVVAVTRFCNWPPEAAKLPSIGDMMKINLETIAAFDPDLVVVSNMNEYTAERIESFGYRTAIVYQDNFRQICDSMVAVGMACGIPERAMDRVDSLVESVGKISARAQGLPQREVLIVVARDLSDNSMNRFYVAGRKSFYNDLLNEAGAVNALADNVQYAQLSREGLLRLNPEMIIDLVGTHGSTETDSSVLQKQWSALGDLAAARNGIRVIRGDFTLRAGPRYPNILDAFIQVIHEGVYEYCE